MNPSDWTDRQGVNRDPGPEGAPDRSFAGPSASLDPLTDVAIPLVIFGMVGSFAFFLIDVRSTWTAGDDDLLRWVFFWFLVGVVCISRVRTKYGNNVIALPYILGLAGAMFVFVGNFTRFTGGGGPGQAALTWFMYLIIGVTWWAVNRLTDECTVEEDSSIGEGESLLDQWVSAAASTAGRKRRHPGRLVILFGLGALLVFAISQRLLAFGGPEQIRHALLYVVICIFCTLVLLALTALSGLRIYLRNRHVQIPARLPSVWVSASVLVATAILVSAALIPRFGMTASETLIERWSGRSSRALEEPAVGGGGVPGMRRPRPGVSAPGGDLESGGPSSESGARGQDRAPGRTSEESTGSGEAGPSSTGPSGARARGQGSDSGSGGGETRSETTAPQPRPEEQSPGETGPRQELSSSRDSQAGEGIPSERKGREPSEASDTAASARSPESMPNAPPLDIFRLLAWVLGILATLALVVFLVRWIKNQRLTGLGPWWQHLRAALARFLGRFCWPRWWRRTSRARVPAPGEPFRNPFADERLLSELPPKELIEYAYRSVLAYARYLGCPKRDSQTPFEFLRLLPQPLQPVREAVSPIVRLYVQRKYTERGVTDEHLRLLHDAWGPLREAVERSMQQRERS